MLRSIHVVKSAQPECTSICRIILSLARYAASGGYELGVLFLEDGPLKAQLRQAGVAAEVTQWSGGCGDVAGAMRVWRWLRLHRAEVLHMHWGGRAARALGRLSGASAVVHQAHARIDEQTGEVPERLRYAWADAVVVCSESLAACVEGHRAEVIPAGIDASEEPRPPMARGGALRVGVLSRLTAIKNVQAVVEAAARLRERGVEIAVEIAGTGVCEAELRGLAARRGVAEQVCFLGWREDTRALLAGWDAVAAGRAVIASRVGGLEELVVDGVTGFLVSARDTEALAQRLSEMAADRARVAAMGAAGWQRARSEFSDEAMARRVMRLYDRLLERGQAGNGNPLG